MLRRISLLSVLIFSAARLSSAAEPQATLESRLLKEGVASLVKAAVSEGDAKRGAVLFHKRSMACQRCHIAAGEESPLGPKLTALKPKRSAEQIVESILFPSKTIDKNYEAVSVLTKDGRVLTGVIKEKTRAGVELLLPQQTGKPLSIPQKEIEEIVTSRLSLMPAGQVNALADRGEFLDLAKYVVEIAEHGPEMAKKLEPDPALLEPLEDGRVDHAALIAKLPEFDIDAGRDLYTRYCVNCHGKDGNKTLNPLARRFAKDPLKFGTDPYSMWKTISYGNGLMFPQSAILSPEERYQVVHFLREEFLRDANPTQYDHPTEEYLAGVNARAEKDAKELGPVKIEVAAGMIDGSQGRRMDYGAYVSHSVAFSPPSNKDADEFADTTERALLVQLAAGNVVCYDTERGSVAGVWNGPLADTTKTHHASYKGSTCLRPGGTVRYQNVDDAGWSVDSLSSAAKSDYSFKGHFLHSGQVLLVHEIGGRTVEELPGVLPGETARFTRTFRVSPGTPEVFCLIGRIKDARFSRNGSAAVLKFKDRILSAAVSGSNDADHFTSDSKGRLWLKIPPADDEQIVSVVYAVGSSGEIDSANGLADVPLGEPDFELLKSGGPRLWKEVVRTRGVLGEPVEGYAADEIAIPFANPWGSWMRTTALDFFSDGSIAVSTLSGDVWIVRWNDDDLSDITWSRFATGLYEPLGLKIVNDVVYVRGRDRITRLRDVNGDGEADQYESFHQEGEIGSGYHAFLFDLQTDRAGNFYFARSGRKSPHKGGVVRVSPDGKKSELICEDFRHPNGLGAGGPEDWITVSDNPDGVSVYNGVAIVREGGKYGYESPRTTPMLAVLPAFADSSSGGQCWTDPDRFGPLSGKMIHTSYSHLTAFYIITENLAPEPNGYSVPLPFAFSSGVMRARANPADGQLYLVGQMGWGSKARYDGCLTRIRYTGSPSRWITDAQATRTGIRLTFSAEIDPDSIKESNIQVARAENKESQPMAFAGVKIVDKQTIEVFLPEMEKETVSARTKVDRKTGEKIVDVFFPIQITLDLKAADGAPIRQTVYATINSIPGKR